MKFAALAWPLILCLILAASPGAAQTPPEPRAAATAPAQLTAEQWRADLRFMAEEMERRHANLYHSTGREAFAAAVADLDARIPSLQRNEIIVGMMRIAALAGDGHTRLDPRRDPQLRFASFPLKLYLFEDGLYVRAAAPRYSELVGARIESIGNVPAEEAIERVSELVSRDNEMGVRFFAPLYLNMPDILNAIGLSDRRDRASFALRRGNRRWRVSVDAGDVEPLWPPDSDISLVTPEGWIDARTTPAPPLWLAAPLEYHRLVELPEHGALYAQLNMVTNTPGQTLAAFGERIRERAEAVNARTIVLDLRLNGGGNGDLRHRFVSELIRAEDDDTRLVVLTARGTYSASQFILDDLDRLTDAVFVGEPARSRPSSFGDSYRSLMPNSGIAVRSSIFWWQAEQNRDPWTWVDVSVPLSFADYATGRDAALETALTYTASAPLSAQLLAAFTEAGASGVRNQLEALISDPLNRHSNLARNVVVAADQLFAQRQGAAALAAAQFAAERFPDYVGAAVELAYVANAQGERELAQREAERALQLEPNNRNARSLLDRLSSTQ